MCHLLLLLPVLALPVFWLWPPALAVPVYGAVLIVSLVVYAMMIAAMRRPVRTGREELLHAVGEVDETLERGQCWVWLHGERWRARAAAEVPPPGTRVRVTAVDGMLLQVEPAPPLPPIPDA